MRNIILASLIVFAVTLPAIADDQNSVFPSIQSQNLNKDVVNLPADFSGDVNLVIFAFKGAFAEGQRVPFGLFNSVF